LEKILGKGLVDVRNQRIKHELFEESRRDDLIQALIAPFPEMFTSLRVQESENKEPEEDLTGSENISEEKVDD
jgi:5-methylcytosine-specific restriction protein B